MFDDAFCSSRVDDTRVGPVFTTGDEARALDEGGTCRGEEERGCAWWCCSGDRRYCPADDGEDVEEDDELVAVAVVVVVVVVVVAVVVEVAVEGEANCRTVGRRIGGPLPLLKPAARGSAVLSLPLLLLLLLLLLTAHSYNIKKRQLIEGERVRNEGTITHTLLMCIFLQKKVTMKETVPLNG